MKPVFHISLAALTVAGALAGGYWLGNSGQFSAHAPTSSASAASGAGDMASPGERTLLYYRNPMGLADTSPVPKKDSMGMDYIAVYAGEEANDSGAVKVSPVRAQAMGVRTALVSEQIIDAQLRAVGRVEANERAIHEVAPRFEGWIDRLHVSATGDAVRRGQALFSAYSPEVQSAQQELAIARSLLESARAGDATARDGALRLVDAAKLRLRNWELPDVQSDGERITFTAPANGVVLEKKAIAGMRFMPGEAIFRIADLWTLWVIADVYEQDIGGVSKGQAVEVSVDAFPSRSFAAKVDYLYPTLNTATRTTPVRLQMANRDGLLRPGMFAQLVFATGGSRPRVVVPQSAIIDDGRKQVVLLVEGEGHYKPQAVKIGMRGREFVEVLEGVQVGERVVVAANFLIDAESNLQAALASFMAPEATAGKVYETTGSVDEVDLSSGTVSMNHDPIPALQWPAMTMDFGLASPELLKGIAPGEPIEFRFEDRGNGEFVVIEAKKRGAVKAGNPARTGHSTTVGH